MATEATLLQAAITTAVAAFGKDGGKAAHRAFRELIEDMTTDG
jgi:hypothetical protein